ncbi:hypothetical protein PC129_g5663 [Phytophthora cactorum]|uniref:Uncharacterized protein n=1 Tax=Phytophthora cactorum TaxID=29920 RepID=A0A329SAR9_9STRA|nr:hypothetical protein PC111_g8966 [Phytophthora cactorum]KAG2857576.1 hypothetical protein PC113_g10569 [Phytophthora cactorum]KAG2939710.1 hypothetical protein PC117_g10840 [Phytophthora cactorum]KAG2981673.1 hypothetical protein PC118_g10452 [Phytophthora cactorum]KAG3018601.1 hypothetical protein PC119_g10616 [Phytophthora cactorum]
MVAPTPKFPRYQLTAQERQLCREAILSDRHERRVRRAELKDDTQRAPQKKATRKKAAMAAMDIPQSKKGRAPPVSVGGVVTADAKKAVVTQATPEAKETLEAKETVEAKEITEAVATTQQPSVSVAEVGGAMNVSADSATPVQSSVPARSATHPSAGKRTRTGRVATRAPSRAVLQDGEEDGDEVQPANEVEYDERSTTYLLVSLMRIRI